MVTYLEPNHSLVGNEFLDHWRVYNGENWVNGFKEKKDAIKFARQNGGTRVAFYKKIKGNKVFVSPERVE